VHDVLLAHYAVQNIRVHGERQALIGGTDAIQKFFQIVLGWQYRFPIRDSHTLLSISSLHMSCSIMSQSLRIPIAIAVPSRPTPHCGSIVVVFRRIFGGIYRGGCSSFAESYQSEENNVWMVVYI